ncbi:MAG TPA: hypothetical protein PJ986_05130 [Gammaproteobacteria bacterium]|nr:hypothetical protein [Gammaproteobacteria bacterium]
MNRSALLATFAVTALAVAPAVAADALDRVLLAQESMDDLFEDDGTAPAATPSEPAATEAASEDAGSAESVDDLFGEPEPAAPAAAETPGEDAGNAESVEGLFGEPAPPAPASTAAAPASVPERQPAVRVSGFYQNEFAYTVPEDGHFSKLRNIFKLRLNGAFNGRIKWQLGGHFEYDPVFEFETFYNDRVEDDEKVFGYVDESYVDIDADNWEFRLGRQHIVWGEMVGLFFADVISALDLREFVLPDFDLIRIPQWAARAEYFNGDFHGEFVYIPIMTVDNLGVFGADYYPFPIELPPGVRGVFLDDKAPRSGWDDFGAGARASYLKNGWDVSLFYYTSPDKTAALDRRIGLAPTPTVTFKPIHERIHQLGSTLAKDFGSFVLKAEAIQTFNRLMSVERLSDLDGLVETDELRYVIGADWAGETGHNVNVQFFQTWFQDHDRDMLFKELETGVSILLTTSSWHPDVTPEILWIRSLDRNEWVLQTKISWDFAEDWRATLGGDVFGGPPTGLFGQFDDTDRIYTELRFSF